MMDLDAHAHRVELLRSLDPALFQLDIDQLHAFPYGCEIIFGAVVVDETTL